MGFVNQVNMNYQMGSPQWLEERRKGIGGTDVAAILGLSPWKTAYRIYQEKRKEVEDWQGSDATDWGKRMEPAIRQWYSDTTGRSVRLPDKIMYHSKHPFMLASLDGFTDDRRVVEIKTARFGKDWGNPGTNEIPDCYALQCQHYLAVTGFKTADVVVSVSGASPDLYEISEDKEMQEMIIEAEARFWQRVTEGRPPEPVSYADAVSRFGKSAAEGIVTASEATSSAVNELITVRGQISELKAKEEEMKGKLIITLGEQGDTLALPDGTKLLTYKLSKGRATFDAKTLERELPAIYKKYLKIGEPQRRFLIKENNIR